MFVHTVFFWLKREASLEERDQTLNDCKTLLAKIPSVKSLRAGLPADTPRGVVDNTYAVGLTVLFDDKAGHDLYQPHELHTQFIERNQASWEKVVVYDYTED